MAGPIVLLTDFGERDGYVGTMKGVILRINPSVTIVDLSHTIPPQDVTDGAFVLGTSYRYFPAGSIFVAVVDPGVGSERRAIALSAGAYTFVGPDNGLFTLVLADFAVPTPDGGGLASLMGTPVTGVVLEKSEYFLPTVSATFHGRDVFAPVAAHHSLGVPLAAFGPPLTEVVSLPSQRPRWENGALSGQVIHVDRFGNAITNITRAELARLTLPVVEVVGLQIVGLQHQYAGASGLLALIGSSDRLEIALNGGNAAVEFGLAVGTPVVVEEARLVDEARLPSREGSGMIDEESRSG
ncbi:MAG TPA: SAM-dependent chlorinase/fluorinase [Chloroflexota bacterium]|nr:SAM-dependent chlorinase/fluorinase [Chloroflexota bacterium]